VSGRGTEGSNPAPSSGESYANLTSSIEVPKILPSGGQRWHAPVVKLGAQFVRLGGDDGEAADPLAQSFLDAVLDGVLTVPGDGAIDFAAVLTALKVADYRGWLVVEAEQDPAKAPPLVYARRGFAHLRTAVRGSGW
jgi:hypothetical protein